MRDTLVPALLAHIHELVYLARWEHEIRAIQFYWAAHDMGYPLAGQSADEGYCSS